MFTNLPLLSSLSISQDIASWSLEVNCLCSLVYPLSLPVTSLSDFSELLCAQPNVSLTFHVPKSFLKTAFIHLHLSGIKIQASSLLYTRQKVLIIHKRLSLLLFYLATSRRDISHPLFSPQHRASLSVAQMFVQ